MKKSRKSPRNTKEESLPGGIIAISILGFIVSLMLLIIALGFFASYSLISTQKDLIVQEALEKVRSDPTDPSSNMTASELAESLDAVMPVFPIIGMVSLALMLLCLISSIFLLLRRNWARLIQVTLAMFFILIGLLFTISPLFIFGIPILIAGCFIAGYLLFNENVQKVFLKNKS